MKHNSTSGEKTACQPALRLHPVCAGNNVTKGKGGKRWAQKKTWEKTHKNNKSKRTRFQGRRAAWPHSCFALQMLWVTARDGQQLRRSSALYKAVQAMWVFWATSGELVDLDYTVIQSDLYVAPERSSRLKTTATTCTIRVDVASPVPVQAQRGSFRFGQLEQA